MGLRKDVPKQKQDRIHDYVSLKPFLSGKKTVYTTILIHDYISRMLLGRGERGRKNQAVYA